LYFHSHRIEHIFDENTQQMPKYIKEYIFYNKLIHAVYVHRRAIELVLVYIVSLNSKAYFAWIIQQTKIIDYRDIYIYIYKFVFIKDSL